VLRHARANLRGDRLCVLAFQAHGSLEPLVGPGRRALPGWPLAREGAAAVLADRGLAFDQDRIDRRSLAWGDLDGFHGRPPLRACCRASRQNALNVMMV